MERVSHFDAVISGAGVGGLNLFRRLTELGLDVMLLEKREHFAGGPTTRNEGWLHAGSVHAGTISDRSMAVQVARQCLYGFHQIRQFAPEAVEEIGPPAIALVKSRRLLTETVSRRNEAGVEYRPVSLQALRRMEPQISTDGLAGAHEVADVAIDTRLLSQKYLASGLARGGRALTGCEIVSFEGQRARVRSQDGASFTVEARLFLHTAGLGLRDFFRTKLGTELPLQVFGSHLLDVPRLASRNVFYIDKFEATLMNHGDWSIVGLNADSGCDPLQVPTSEPTLSGTRRLQKALKRLIPNADLSLAHARRCCKLSMIRPSDSATPAPNRPQLNVAFGEVPPCHVWVIPGKMTEAPFVVDVLVKTIFDRLARSSDFMVASRPIDQYLPAHPMAHGRTRITLHLHRQPLQLPALPGKLQRDSEVLPEVAA
jgi:glycine/D-amino acid oxidase-like deaminating enzyme